MKGGKKATNVFFFFPTRTKCISRPAAGNKKPTSYLLSKRLACTKCKVPKDKQNLLTIRSRLVWCVVVTEQDSGEYSILYNPSHCIQAFILIAALSSPPKGTFAGQMFFRFRSRGEFERGEILLSKKSSRSVPLNFKLI